MKEQQNLQMLMVIEVGGKTGTANKTSIGGYSKAKVNTFAGIFPISNPKYVLIVLLDEPKIVSIFIIIEMILSQ